MAGGRPSSGSKRAQSMIALSKAQDSGAKQAPKRTSNYQTPLAEANTARKRPRADIPDNFTDLDGFEVPSLAQKPRHATTPASAGAAGRGAYTPQTVVPSPALPRSSRPTGQLNFRAPYIPQPRMTPFTFQNRMAGRSSLLPWGRSFRNRSAPAGLFNLGNTCYLNAVLQSLFCLPTFPGAVRTAAAAAGTALRPDGVVAALRSCLAERDASTARGYGAFSPEQIKQAVGRSMGAFQGYLQQDAHEFFCALLEAAQNEIITAEADKLGRRTLRVSETADPATRVFGLALEHELTCSGCGNCSVVTEQSTHLSLDLPRYSSSTVVPPGLEFMLGAYFEDEIVEKGCEGCGAGSIDHTVRHRIKRLPQILALHLKRFQVEALAGGSVACTKLRTAVSIAQTLRMRQFCVEQPTPPLPAVQPPAPEKENVEFNLSQEPEQQQQHLLPLSWTAAVTAAALPPEKSPTTAGARTAASAAAPAVQPTDFYSGGSGVIPFTRKGGSKKQASGAAVTDYWDNPAGAQRSGTFAGAMADIIPGTVAAANKDYDLEAAIEASKRDAEEVKREQKRAQWVSEEEEQLAAAIKRSLEEQTAAEEAEGVIDLAASSPVMQPADAPQPMLPLIVEDADFEGEESGCGGEHGGSVKQLQAAAEITPSRYISAANYRLTSVISHHGHSAQSGHFTADARDPKTAEWHRYDDARVVAINGEAVGKRETDCYILFFAFMEPGA